MKPLLLFVFAGLLATSSCKKFIDQQKEDYVLGIMTDGRWYLQNYTEYGVDKTSDFASYEFQFYKDNKIDAISNTVTTSGTWTADINNISMTINFPASSNDMKRLSYVWKITDSYTNLVYAETTTAQGTISIRLMKK